MGSPLEGVPRGLDALGGELDGDGEDAVLDRGGERLHAQGVGTGRCQALDLDHRHAEAIEELRDLELALEGEGSLAASRDPLHRDVADTDGVHGPSAFQVARAF